MNTTLLKTIIRNFLQGKRSSLINLIGLTFGFTVFIAIVFYIREELNYNQFHTKIDAIYSVFTQDQNTTNGLGYNGSVPAIAEALRTEYPGVEDAALFYAGTLRFLIANDQSSYYEQVQLADPNLFSIFSFPILKGQIPKIKDESFVLALSSRMAQKYFPDENPIGKTLKINNNQDFRVVAVFENIPYNSSLQFNIWFPIQLLTLYESDDALNTWYNCSFQCYALLNINADFSEINKNLYNRIQKSNPGSTERAQLYPFKDMYLQAWGNNKNIRTMVMIALIILTLVSLNFINLQISESFIRIRNFGIKRINGATHFAITRQLFFEALVFCLVASMLAFGLAKGLSGYLFNLLGKPNANLFLISTSSILMVLGAAFVIAFISGVIPSMVIKVVSPANAIKNKISNHFGVKRLQLVFTTLQFCLAIVLVICLITTNQQVFYLHHKNLGFNKDQIVFVHIDGDLQEKKELLREEIKKNPAIINATLASRSPIGIYWNGGGWDWESRDPNFDPMITYIETDEYFQETFAIKMKEGQYVKNDVFGVVVNETFAKMIAPNASALNHLLVSESQDIQVPVLGIINDINFKPLSQKITPLMIIPQLGYDAMRYIFIKISADNMEEGLAHIEKTVKALNPNFPCEYFFLDTYYAQQYKNEEELRNQMMFFSFLAIFISCMGLWGILLFTIKQRTKEIGIRKVNGAKELEIISLLNMDFIKWVTLAFIIASPIAFFIMQNWLQSFAYHINLSWWIFVLSGIIALSIALLTVSFQTWRAASRNPVEALRYE